MISNSDSTEVSFNKIENSRSYGVYVTTGSENNIIHHNEFIFNNYGGSGSQVHDSGLNTIWFDVNTNEGNYYDDWSGDGPYFIDGLANTYDPFPLEFNEIPTIIPEFNREFYALLLIIITSTIIATKFRNEHTFIKLPLK